MSFFARRNVSPYDRLWHDSAPPPPKKKLPVWQYYTDTLAAQPVGATPFFLSGPQVITTAPFADVLVPGCSLEIPVGQIAVVRLLNVWKLRGGTLDPPAAQSFWTLALDGVPVGDGWQSVYTFGVGGPINGLNGLFIWPVDLRIAASGTLDIRVTIQDPAMAGSNITICGIMQGWLYPEALDIELDTAREG